MKGLAATELFHAAHLEDPYPLYARLRAQGPVCPLHGSRAFYVAGHAAVEEAVRRHEEFSARLTGVLLRDPQGGASLFEFAGAGTASDVIATADEPEHAAQRRLLMPSMKASRTVQMEEPVRAFARERIAAFVRAGGGDWCAAVGEPVPAFVVTQLLGLGADAVELVQRWAMMGGDMLGGLIDTSGMQRLLQETGRMTAFLGAHLQSTLALEPHARSGSLTDTLAGGIESGVISHEQATGILVILFGAAGESTAALLGYSLRLMLATPGLQERLRADPALIEAFVEEAVRLETPFKFHYRVVKQPTTLCGTELEGGDRLLLGWGAANRDPAAFEAPDELRLERHQPQRHLGFGHGIHFCIGAPLARLEARITLEELFRQCRWVEADALRQPRVVPSIFIRRLAELPLRCHR
jgi:cytochrome P450